MTDQPQIDFNSLPTEALFSFFFALDPLTLGKYNTVSKRWSQLCKDNELWRQYCLQRWEKNPKESDCTRNWLIPVREGGGQKETRIDWKKVYVLRDNADKAKEVVDLLMNASNKSKLAFLKKKKSADPFSKGWPTMEDLTAFDKRVHIAWRKASDITGDEPFPFEASELHEKFMHVIDFYFEMELLMLKQSTVARQKYLLLTANFLNKFSEFIKEMIVVLPGRLAKTAATYADIAREKDIPIEIVTKHLDSCAKIFAAMNENTPLKYFHPIYFSNITLFMTTIVKVMETWPLDEAFDKWINTFVDAETTTSPTYDLEECLDIVSFSLRSNAKFVYELMKKMVEYIGPPNTYRKRLTVMSVIVGFTSGCKEHVGKNLSQFMDEFFFPFFEPKSDPKEAISMLYYCSASLFFIDREVNPAIETKILSQFIKMTDVKNDTYQKQLCNFIISYCERIFEHEFMLPFLPALLDIFYCLLRTDNIDLRVDAILAISSLIITCQSVFNQHRESLMKEFKEILLKTNGEKKTREAVIEAMVRIGAGVENNDISTELESTYEQMIEDFKKDRPANEEMLVKMTEFFVTALGQRFEKYLAFIFPIILEQINSNVIDVVAPANPPQNNNNNNGANGNQTNTANAATEQEGEDEDEDIQMNEEPEVKVNSLQATLKKSAINALLKIISELEYKTIAPIKTGLYDSIVSILRGDNTIECMTLAAEAYYQFALKFEGAANKSNRFTFLNDTVLIFLNAIVLIANMADRAKILNWFNQILQHLLTVGADEEPVLTVMNTRVLTSTVNELMQMLDEDVPIEDRKEFAIEIANLYEYICSNVKGEARSKFFEICRDLYERAIQTFADAGANEERWFEVSLLVITFDHLGDLFKGVDSMMNLLPVLELCREIDADDVQQSIAYHFGVMVKKYPSYLPSDDGLHHLTWLLSMLSPEVRSTSPALYDNVLVSVGHTLEYWQAKKKDITAYFKQFAMNLPPTGNGDNAEGVTCFEILIRLATNDPDLVKKDEAVLTHLKEAGNAGRKVPDFGAVSTRWLIWIQKNT